jgi:indolepyruvate ferredoxin oxidoreductase alpha subunit
MPYPLPARAVFAEIESFEDILVIEETDPVMEMQIGRRDRVHGRLDGSIPAQGELVPDVLEETLRKFTNLPAVKRPQPAGKPRRPTLCPGCPHRAAFHALREALPQGIYPSDIGCYTLGLNLGAVDTVLCMGAAISQASGFYHAYKMRGENRPIAATIGDSTFFHAGIPALINAVHTGARFILLILDNATTAMTGDQPTPGLDRLADGRPAQAVAIEDLVKACGVTEVKVMDPYDLESLTRAIKSAEKAIQAGTGGIYVIISRHPCLMSPGVSKAQTSWRMEITADCIACEICHQDFECPAIGADPQTGLAQIDTNLCSGCGVCVNVCPQGAIKKK